MSDFVFGLADQTPAATPVDETDGVYVHNTEHADQAVGHLIEFFRQGPRNQLLLAAVMEQVQELEDELWAMSTAFDVDDAVGDQLDIIGRLNGEARDNRSDAEYRTAIKVRMLVNRSDGKVEQLIEILELIDPTCTIYFAENFPASVAISTDAISTAVFEDVDALLQQAKPAGVRLHFSVGESALGVVPAPDGPGGAPAGGVMGVAPAPDGPGGAPAGFVMARGS